MFVKSAFLNEFLEEEVYVKFKSEILLVQTYGDNILFGNTNHSLCEKFSKFMQNIFKMSMKGDELFLGTSSQTVDDYNLVNVENYFYIGKFLKML